MANPSGRSDASRPASPKRSRPASPATPCRYTPIRAAENGARPWASNEPIAPARTSPVPPVARAGFSNGAIAAAGYLLPFDQRSFWASVVGININGTGPVVGPYLSDFLRAGPELGATTLSRFYAIHMLLLPGRDHRPDRRPPLPGGQARHHGAALGDAKSQRPRSRLRSSTPAPMGQRRQRSGANR